MTLPILVTGGTGMLGQLVVGRLLGEGCQVRVLSRQAREPIAGIQFVTGDLQTGAGIEAAVAGVGTIVHLASRNKGDAADTRNLVRAAASGTSALHLLYISIVGVDRPTFGYMRSKLEAEQVVIGSGLPWTLLRSTIFYDYVLNGLVQFTKLPVVPVPAGFPLQPIDADDTAARLTELALGKPAGRVADIGGPQVMTWESMTREYLRATHRRRLVVPIPLPGRRFREIRVGAFVLPDQAADPAEVAGRTTGSEFLARRAA